MFLRNPKPSKRGLRSDDVLFSSHLPPLWQIPALPLDAAVCSFSAKTGETWGQNGLVVVLAEASAAYQQVQLAAAGHDEGVWTGTKQRDR